MQTLKVVTITLNPAMDLTGSLSSLNRGEVNSIQSSDLHPAGKGVNVAKVLCDLGAQVTVTGFLGDENQDAFVQTFLDMGAKDEFVRIHGANRINVKLVEKTGDVTDVNFPGCTVTPKDTQAFELKLNALAQEYDVFVMAGSLPSGLDPEQAAKWIALLREKGKTVFFDSSNLALQAGVNAKPSFIKPNEVEISQLAALRGDTVDPHNLSEVKAYAEKLAAEGIENVVISLGADGVIWLKGGQWIEAKPPRQKVVSTVGAGDSLVAGLCWGVINHWPEEELLGFASALGALAVTQVGVGVSDIDALREFSKQVETKK